ncbi:MAG: glycosyltransferase family 39 protein [Planctomycetes bacterium]|nr:glycosyltransferase family 39 protein [Planctomycetota bacterium]
MTLSDEARTAEKKFTWLALAAMLAIFAYASFLSSRSTLFDRDEPRFAQASVEMLTSGNWLYPTFDGELRADKPVFVYWLMAQAIHVFGATAWAARFWSPVCLALACGLVFLVGRKLFEGRTGLLAMGFMALSPLALAEGTLATTDALLLLCLTLVMSIFVYAAVDGPRPMHFVGIALTCAGAILAKGPVGVVIPALSIGFAVWLLRNERGIGRAHRLWFAVALAAAVGLVLLWWIPADRATGGEYGTRGLGNHVFDRALSPLEGHGGGFLISLPFYVPVLAVGFLSGLMFLPGAFSALLGERIGNKRTRILLIAWIVPTFLLMTLVATKLPHYVLPIWPALAIASAAVVDAAERGVLDDRDRSWLSSGTWIFGVVSVLIIGCLIAAPSYLQVDALLLPGIATSVALAATAVFAMHAHRRNHPRRAACIALLGLGVTWIVGVLLVVPAVEHTKVAPQLAAAIRTHVPASVQIARWKFVEPSLDFYLGRPPIKDFDDEDSLRRWAAEDSPAVLVIPRNVLAGLRDVLPESRYSELAAVEGLNLSKGERLVLVALARDLPSTEAR